ncbi:CHASE3 domain-containing protein [Phenylobacterium sp. J426]|uniref:CHASE3 domain-containing protein n=1 Tax=Phenylobacterium sp. J426 TaxID=2898439 RepID=UPI002151C0AD|nr:CHASE3 domain-containing protein [Phenylobacterium sp. J426]MCR5873844.1 CHASE3 domain-containing protein [Phenylobacterium sp. J426]
MIGGWTATLRRRFSQDALFWLCAATVILLIPILLAVAWRATSDEQRQQDAAQAAMVRSADRRASIQAFALTLKDAESSHRGYLLAGDRDFLRRYEAVAPALEQRIASLELAYADQPEQQARLADIRALAQKRFATMEEARRVRDVQGLSAAAAIVATGRGEALMEQLRAATDAITAAEARNLAERLRSAERQTQQARAVASVSYGLVLLAILLAAVMAFRYTALRTSLIGRARAEAERRQAIFDAAMDAIVTFNPSGGVETMNRAAEQMFGYTAEELQGRDISVLVPEALGGDALFLERIRRERGLREGASCELEARAPGRRDLPRRHQFRGDGPTRTASMRWR